MALGAIGARAVEVWFSREKFWDFGKMSPLPVAGCYPQYGVGEVSDSGDWGKVLNPFYKIVLFLRSPRIPDSPKPHIDGKRGKPPR